MLKFTSLIAIALAMAQETPEPPKLPTDTGGLSGFVSLNEKLKNAVCDESVASRAPTLEAVSPRSASSRVYAFELDSLLAEHQLISFLLGDSIVGVYSPYVREQLFLALGKRGLAGLLDNRGLITNEEVVEAQATIAAVKRRFAIEICEAQLQESRLKILLGERPNRFLDLLSEPLTKGKHARFIEVLDTEGRFGRFEARTLAPGWVESFEVDRVVVGTRVYRRISNPLTNNTQMIEVSTIQGYPLGILYPSHEVGGTDWAWHKSWADSPEARLRHVELYRQRIEFEAIAALHTGRAPASKVRDLQEFYKNLLQAYQLFPNEKQFDTYKGQKLTIDDVTQNVLGAEFLSALKNARVNGSFVRFGLFRPDPKLHAIYLEYASRLAKLKP